MGKFTSIYPRTCLLPSSHCSCFATFAWLIVCLVEWRESSAKRDFLCEHQLTRFPCSTPKGFEAKDPRQVDCLEGNQEAKDREEAREQEQG